MSQNNSIFRAICNEPSRFIEFFSEKQKEVNTSYWKSKNLAFIYQHVDAIFQ